MSKPESSVQVSKEMPSAVSSDGAKATELTLPSSVVDRTILSRDKSLMLIICIDRDNDVGLKTGLETPIIGKAACLDAATKLALADPEEADANTIFAAVKEYEELQSKGQKCEVVTVGGLFERGVLGDKKIRDEIEEILRDCPASEAVIVADVIEGEELTPVITPLVPVVSIRKVIIKHSKSVEESYEILGRYFRMLLFDKRYSKYALGIPGLIFIGVAIAYKAEPGIAPLVLIGLIGIILTVRGFNIDREIGSIRNLSAAGYLRLFAVIISVFIVIGGIVSGVYPFFFPSGGPQPNPAYTYVWITNKGNLNVSNIPKILGFFINGAQLLTWLGLAIYVVGALFFNFLRPQHRHVLRNLVALIVLGLLYYPVQLLGGVLLSPSGGSVPNFVGYALFSLAVSFVIAAYIYSRVTIRRGHPEAEEIEV